MGKGNFTDELRRDAIKQITERGCSVADASEASGCRHTLALRMDEAL